MVFRWDCAVAWILVDNADGIDIPVRASKGFSNFPISFDFRIEYESNSTVAILSLVIYYYNTCRTNGTTKYKFFNVKNKLFSQ